MPRPVAPEIKRCRTFTLRRSGATCVIRRPSTPA